MTFLSIVDANMKDCTDYPLRLRVVRSDGFDSNRDVTINVTDLNLDGEWNYKHFNKSSVGGTKFKVNVLIKDTDTYTSPNLTDSVVNILDKWYREGTVVKVVTDAIRIKNGKYIITNNSNRKQTYENSVIWSLEFTEYISVLVGEWQNNNSKIMDAVKNKIKKASAKNTSTTCSKLKKCKLSSLTYSKKKKTVTCVKYLQQRLYKKGYLTKSQVDGWFGDKTKAAVKKFQQKYNKKPVKTITIKNSVGVIKNDKKMLNVKLPTNGKVDKATRDALCE